jgi:hypothetical protein
LKELTEGRDYYLSEDGFVVLTEKHHLDRGYCCGLSCLHCPYGYEAVPEPKQSEMILKNLNKKSDE